VPKYNFGTLLTNHRDILQCFVVHDLAQKTYSRQNRHSYLC